MRSTQELLRKAYAAFNTRNIGAVLAMMHPDVDWPNAMEGGRVQGQAAVRDYWTRQWAIIDPHVEPRRFAIDEAGRTLVEVHQVIRDLTGKVLSDRIVQHVYTVRDGLIERMEINEVTTP
ncbi:MAG TPA: nuclear transport factor 2 family protein [Candidatus Angelobacter sp.]|nr:nuclear transport factor 2 family protein [Candidatus Angelobacter sp.]